MVLRKEKKKTLLSKSIAAFISDEDFLQYVSRALQEYNSENI